MRTHRILAGLFVAVAVFVDTMLICSTAALVIPVTDTWSSGPTGGR